MLNREDKFTLGCAATFVGFLFLMAVAAYILPANGWGF